MRARTAQVRSSLASGRTTLTRLNNPPTASAASRIALFRASRMREENPSKLRHILERTAQFERRMMSQMDLTKDESERAPPIVLGAFCIGCSLVVA